MCIFFIKKNKIKTEGIMTQKELLYFEDGIGHEKNIIKICEESLKNLEDNRLISFMKNEINMHENLKNQLMDKLKEKANG